MSVPRHRVDHRQRDDGRDGGKPIAQLWNGGAEVLSLMGQLGVVLSGRIGGLGCDGNRSERVGRSPFG
jgi:hypothetical protein